MSTTQEFLEVLHPDLNGAFIEVRHFVDGKREAKYQRFFKTIEEVIAAIPATPEAQEGCGIFVGICPRSESGNGTKTSIKQVFCLWADLDGKDFKGGKEEARRRLRESPLPPTLIVDSGNGFHAYWLFKEPEPIQNEADIVKIKSYLKQLAKFLNGDPTVAEIARVMRVPGTYNLKNPTSPLPVRIIEIEPNRRYNLSTFDDWLPALEQQETPSTDNPPGWVASILKELREGERGDCHNVFVKAIGKFIKSGFIQEDTYQLLLPHLEQVTHDGHQYSSEQLKKDIADMYPRYAHKSVSAKTTEKVNYSAQFEGLVDLVEHKGSVAYLIREGSQLSILPEIELNGTLYVPPPKEQIPWLLPQGDAILEHFRTDNDAALYDDLKAYHAQISEPPSEQHYDYFAAWVMHTYVLEAVHYSPMNWLFAIPERGKTRTGKGMIYVAYRGIHLESLREAYLFRVAKNFTATIFFDVMDIWRKAEQIGSEDILLLRFEKGATVARVLYPDRGAFKDTEYYPVFGATIIGTNVSMHPILETRCLMTTMPPSDRNFEVPVTPEMGLPLKERLVAFRARHLGESLPELNKPARGRLGDITKPLLQIIKLVRPSQETALRTLIADTGEKRQQEKTESIEGQLLLTIRNLTDHVTNNKLSVQKIVDAFNAGRTEKNQLSNRSIGWKLKALGFEKTSTSEGNSAIWWNEQKLQIPLAEHGIRRIAETPKTPETQELDRAVNLAKQVFGAVPVDTSGS